MTNVLYVYNHRISRPCLVFYDLLLVWFIRFWKSKITLLMKQWLMNNTCQWCCLQDDSCPPQSPENDYHFYHIIYSLLLLSYCYLFIIIMKHNKYIRIVAHYNRLKMTWYSVWCQWGLWWKYYLSLYSPMLRIR